MNLRELIKQFKVDKQEFAVWFLTTVAIVSTDLLKGIAFGFALSLVKLFLHIHKLDIDKKESETDKAVLHLSGKASFLTVPTMAKTIELHAKNKKSIEINISKLLYKDKAFDDYISGLEETLRHRGVVFKISS